MKKIYISVVFMFFLLICNGQSLLHEGKLWSNTLIGTEGGSTYRSFFIKFSGDTTINGLGYKKIMKSDDELHTTWTLDGCIREEPDTRKVFIFNKFSQKDILLYDFNLELGDSILTGDGVSYAKVTKVINATFGSSSDIRKQIYFFDADGGPQWIEGIGSIWGVLEGLGSFYTTGATPSLVCYSQNDQLIYHNHKFNNCFPQGQELIVDAGSDVMVCTPNHSEDRTQLSGVASGGVEPYTYTWSAKQIKHLSPQDSLWVYASDLLNDTTLSNPSFKSMDAPENWFTFHLKVEDAAGNVKVDSVKVIDAFIYSGGGYMLPVTIHRGDSVQFFGTHYIFDSNFPIQHSLIPTTGLTDPTDLYGWAKPDTSTTYYLQLVNSAGCVSKIEYWRINVDTTSVSASDVANRSAQCYLNQGDLMINLPASNNLPYHLTITSANGAIVHTGIYRNRDLRLSSISLKGNQLYVVSIIDVNEKKVFKLIGN